MERTWKSWGPGHEARTLPSARAPGSVAAPDAAVHTIGNYRLDDVLGEGGMGTVYRGTHVVLDRAVAIKVLNDDLGRDAAQVHRFLDEARALAAVRGPDVVELLDCGVLGDGRPYLVMELLRGETLGQRLRDRGALTEPETIAIGRALAAALVAVHAHGIVHRDLKPDNVFLTGDAWAAIKLLDFGVAKAPRGGGLDAELMLGTPAYMAPEQYEDAQMVDHRADLYGLGCVLFEMLTGCPPFATGCAIRIISERERSPAPRVHTLAPSVSAPLDHLIAALLARCPDDRPPCARAVTTLLDELVRAGGDSASFDRTATEQWPRRAPIAR